MCSERHSISRTVALKKVAACSSETPVSTHKSTRRYNQNTKVCTFNGRSFSLRIKFTNNTIFGQNYLSMSQSKANNFNRIQSIVKPRKQLKCGWGKFYCRSMYELTACLGRCERETTVSADISFSCGRISTLSIANTRCCEHTCI